MSPIIVDKEQKKLHIMGSALNVFLRKGFKETKIQDIADEAGIGKGTVYEYFNGKEGIGVELYRWLCDISNRYALESIEEKDDTIERVRKYIRSTLELYEQFSEYGPFYYAIYSISSDRENSLKVKAPLSEAFLIDVKSLSEIIEEGVEQGLIRKIDDEDLALIILSTLEGFAIYRDLAPKSYTPEQASSMITGFLIQGVGTEKGKRRWEE
jgi:AcrR family transcriptional regulator